MVKTKRAARQDDEPTTGSGTPVPPTPTEPTPGPSMAKWLIGLAVLSLLVIGGPVVLWAQTNPVSPYIGGKVLVDASALKNLQEQLSALQASLTALLGAQQQTTAEIGQQMTENKWPGTVADCLRTCGKDLSSCKFTAVSAATGLDPCISAANTCITKCSDPPVSCQDRCSVTLGGCLAKTIGTAGANLLLSPEVTNAAIDACKQSNLTCLVNACKLGSPDNVPADYCLDQCSRMNDICTGGSAQYNKDSMSMCDQLSKVCKSQMCQAPQASSVGSTCTDDEMKECTDLAYKYIQGGDEEGARVTMQDCVGKCGKVGELPAKEQALPAAPSEASCSDTQIHYCGMINDQCLKLVQDETACKTLQGICVGKCSSCSSETIDACHNSYLYCTTGSCYSGGVAQCLTQCPANQELPPQGTTPMNPTNGGEQSLTAPPGVPTQDDQSMTCYKIACVPEYQQCQLSDNISLTVCQDNLSTCKGQCYGTDDKSVCYKTNCISKYQQCMTPGNANEDVCKEALESCKNECFGTIMQ